MTVYANYLPDEILLEVLAYIEAWDTRSKQTTLANFSYVNRQWYDVAIQPLYDSPFLTGRAYDLFVRTICPSVLAHIKKQNLANLRASSAAQKQASKSSSPRKPASRSTAGPASPSATSCASSTSVWSANALASRVWLKPSAASPESKPFTSHDARTETRAAR
ncbi:hypothetical protein OPT61_g9199 [Boeremia exigua]|uniref:Uncharacterized protein n=1 Tax=Boeremia exigua TaxID=749465 RepID=A0ACC2HV36_9PLEO|nr:hypothetical protein OPT61_g9199 [Boeremia exigua]